MTLESPTHFEPVIIKHPERVEQTRSLIRKGGVKKFHVISDFAKTLTREYVNGERIPPVVAQLRNGDFLGPEYPAKAQALFDRFAPFEKDISKGIAERNALMLKWWRTHFELLIKSGFNHQVAKDVVARGSTKLRERLPQFMHFLDQHDIPLVILTATPGDLTLAYLQSVGLFTKHVHIAGNLYDFDESGKAIRMPPPIIHTHNKGSIPLTKQSFYDDIRDRPNILLLGDGLEDLAMLDSDPHEHALTVGFYNKPTEAELELYTEKYDIVLTGDGSMEYVNELLADLFA